MAPLVLPHSHIPNQWVRLLLLPFGGAVPICSPPQKNKMASTTHQKKKEETKKKHEKEERKGGKKRRRKKTPGRSFPAPRPSLDMEETQPSTGAVRRTSHRKPRSVRRCARQWDTWTVSPFSDPPLEVTHFWWVKWGNYHSTPTGSKKLRSR